MIGKPPLDTIVCLSLTEWDGLPHNSRHLMVEASRRGYRVLYVDPIGIRRPRLTRRDLAKIARRLRHVPRPIAPVADRIWRLAPLGIPLQDTHFGHQANSRLLTAQIRRALDRMGAKRVLLWSYSPQLLDLKDSLGAELAIYYRTDAYPFAPAVKSGYLTTKEEQAVELADLCIAVNGLSLSDLPREPRRSMIVPNGIDLNTFDSSGAPEDALAGLPHPRLLVIGTFDSWMDIRLLRDVLDIRPDLSLVLAGERKTSLSRLTDTGRAHYLGKLEYERLPDLISSCDIGLVPFVVNPFTTRGCPGKIYQYLARGLPVLCTPFIDASGFSDLVSVAQGEPEPFAAAIDELLGSDSASLAKARRKFASAQTYSARFDAIEAVLGELAALRHAACKGIPA